MNKAIGRAVRLYEDFREARPKKIGAVKVRVPKAVAVIGYLESVDYRTTHGSKVELYRHDFAPGSRPLLAVSEDGKQLLLLGGRYQFTAQGIVDKDARGKLITNPKHGKAINPRGALFPRHSPESSFASQKREQRAAKKRVAQKRAARRANPADFMRMEQADVSRVHEIVKREQAALRAGLKLPARTPRESTLLRQYVATYGLSRAK